MEVCGIPGPISSLLTPGVRLKISDGSLLLLLLPLKGSANWDSYQSLCPDFPHLPPPSQRGERSFTCCGLSRLGRALAAGISTPGGFDSEFIRDLGGGAGSA